MGTAGEYLLLSCRRGLSVCVRERDRHWEKAMSGVLHSVHSNVRKIRRAKRLSLAYQARERQRILQPHGIWRLVAALPAGKWQTAERLYELKTCFLIEKVRILGWCAVCFGKWIPTFRRKLSPSVSVYKSVNWFIILKMHAYASSKIRNKLPNHTVQQPWRRVSSTITQRNPQMAVSVLLRIRLFPIILSSSFIVVI